MKFHVHAYRELRLTFRNIEADSPEAAAKRTETMPTPEAGEVADCDGQTLAFTVDVVGDDEYQHSKTFDNPDNRDMRAIREHPALLAALRELHELIHAGDMPHWPNLPQVDLASRSYVTLATAVERLTHDLFASLPATTQGD